MRSFIPLYQVKRYPPFVSMTEPVQLLSRIAYLSPLALDSTCTVETYKYDSATSSALPISPVGIFCLMVAINPSSCSFGMWSHRGVSTTPGLMRFTLMGAFEGQHIHRAICPNLSQSCVFTSGIAHLGQVPSCALYHVSLYASSVTSLSM